MAKEQRDASLVIVPGGGSIVRELKELRSYGGLVALLVKRSYQTTYRQTILGPIWLIVHPLAGALIYWVVFGKMLGIGTDGVPGMLFYLVSSALWTLFSSLAACNARTFTDYAAVFSKVYFPRLAVPAANACVFLLKFLIQLAVCLPFFAFYRPGRQFHVHISLLWLLLLCILQLSLLGSAVGLLIACATVRYRDLSIVVSFALQLWMYASPVVYPLSETKMNGFQRILLCNPVAMPLEIGRYVLFGTGTIVPACVALGWCVTAALCFLGCLCYVRVARTAMDTV